MSIHDQRNGVTRYSYDPIGRILSAVQPNLTERFAFDPAHNLLDSTVASVGRVEGNRIRVYEDKRYDYDEHGNVVEKLIGKHTRMRFEWNAAHQMVKSVVARNSSDTAQTVRYAYDPFGRRIAKKDAFGVTRFVWDGNRLLCEQRGSHARTYVYGEHEFVPLARIDSLLTEHIVIPAEVRHLHLDHHGTPRELTNSAGSIIWAASYRTWGNVVAVSDEVSSLAAAEQPYDHELAQPVRSQGQYCDAETGLHYNRFRYYDPDTGRFVSIDPIGLRGGANTYRFAQNPIGWVDPLGLAPCNGDGAASGAAKSGRLSFPATPEELTEILGVQPKKIGVTPDGTKRVVWEPNANTRIRFESHPEGLSPGSAGYNPRHHGEHFHVEIKPDGVSWNNASKNGLITKPEPPGYRLGSGKGFLAGEEFPDYK
ncbi:RHS repeat domain-containing protein [Massilia sp. YMA4]|uniref:RHS repeat domain-containing protein n=1 Tax=Massilia sp. YMA4 TaxID=1593482 RepID=UPI001583DDBC|nr:RHS repeat-associated core domain-containing protein [Massilia sp. YMA4]